MELSTLATSKNEKEGKWFRVELYGKKQDFALKLLGSDSDEVISFQRDKIRNLNISGKTYEEMNDDEIEELIEMGNENAIIRIAGISSIKVTRKGWELTDVPVTMNGEELKNDEKSYKKLIENIPAIKDFIFNISKKRDNFLD